MASTIILSDNGASSGSAGLKQTAGNDGVLILQTTTSGGTATNAVYVDTSQRVGIGQSTPAYLLDVNGTMRLGSAGSIQPLLLRSSVTGGLLVNNTASGGAGPLIVQDNGTEVLRVTDSLVVLKGGNTAATGTGITFPATQSASSDANTLDDYEEGTFTVTLTGSTSGAPGTYGTRNAYYTKIGRMVYVTLQVVGFSKGTLIGNLIVGGLPFTIQNSANATGTLRYELPSPTAGTTVILPQGADGTTYLDIQLFTNAGFNGGYNTSGLSASATNNIYNLVYIYQTST